MMVVHGKFEWDSNKNEINIKKHGLSFDAILEVFNDPYFIEKIDIEHSTLEEETNRDWEFERFCNNHDCVYGT
ncbi:BrnT family toxin [Treponema sp. OMZ 805]|uniref:BrnT family toxin n=1 Tax=Treponema sp. OMZ 805 TaxID=2726068 RepID=UPI003D93717A